MTESDDAVYDHMDDMDDMDDMDVASTPSDDAPPLSPLDSDSSPIADDILHRIEPAWVTTERIGSWIFTSLVSLSGLVFCVVAYFAWIDAWWVTVIVLAGWVLITSVLGWTSHVYPHLAWTRTRYRVSPLGVEIRRGVWWRSVTDVPRTRIQHTDVNQGPLLRKFGLATLVIHTAGTADASINLPGLEYERAMAMRDFLIRGGHGDGV